MAATIRTPATEGRITTARLTTVLLTAVLVATASCSVHAEEAAPTVEGTSDQVEPDQNTSESTRVAAETVGQQSIPQLPDVDRPCVDASGPNSTPDDIVHAALDTPSMIGANGLVPEFEYASRFQSEVPEQLDPYEISSPRYYQGDVPEGGDAAFADIACDLAPYTWGRQLTEDEIASILAAPGFVRSQGRMTCTSLHDDEDPRKRIDMGEQEIAEYAVDSVGAAAGAVAQFEEQLASAEAELASPTWDPTYPADYTLILTSAVESAKRGFEWARRQTDESIQYVTIAQVETMKAAYRYQCPD